jgi:hypothetical protein
MKLAACLGTETTSMEETGMLEKDRVQLLFVTFR